MDGPNYVDFSTSFTNNRVYVQRRSRSAVELALKKIWNKARRVISTTDDPRSTYLMVQGYRADALKDFQSFQPKQTWTERGDFVGEMGVAGIKEVRVSATKGRKLPVLQITQNNAADKSVTTVIYCDGRKEIGKVYKSIKIHKDLSY